MRYFSKIIVFLITALSLSACSYFRVHKLDVQQGNIVTPSMLQTVKLGMSQDQVQYIMGKPILTNPFDQNRWDYVYTYKPGYGNYLSQQLSLYFKNDRLVSIQGHINPSTIAGIPIVPTSENNVSPLALTSQAINTPEVANNTTSTTSTNKTNTAYIPQPATINRKTPQ